MRLLRWQLMAQMRNAADALARLTVSCRTKESTSCFAGDDQPCLRVHHIASEALPQASSPMQHFVTAQPYRVHQHQSAIAAGCVDAVHPSIVSVWHVGSRCKKQNLSRRGPKHECEKYDCRQIPEFSRCIAFSVLQMSVSVRLMAQCGMEACPSCQNFAMTF